MIKKFCLSIVFSILAASCASNSSVLKEITPTDAYQFQMNKTAVIIDVREGNETIKGRVKDSVLIPMSMMKNDSTAFNDRLMDLKKFKNVIVYCHSGRRAEIVGQEMQKAGLNVLNMGGFDSWKAQKLPIE